MSLPSRPIYYSLVVLAVGVGAYAIWIRTALGNATRIAEQQNAAWLAEHQQGLEFAAKAQLLEDQRAELLRQRTEAERISAYWKAKATLPVPPPDIPATTIEVAARWRELGFPSALELPEEGVRLALGDSKKALGMVIQAPVLSERLQDALHAVSSVEDQLGAEKRVAENYRLSSAHFEGAYRAEARGAEALVAENAQVKRQLKLERRWGNLKIGGAVALTALVTWKLAK